MGGKFGKRNHIESRRAARDNKVEVADEVSDRWCPPSKYDCKPNDGTIIGPLSATARVLQRLEYEGRRLVYYSISQQTLTREGKWAEVVRIDCSDCEVHMHTFFGEPRRTLIQPISVPEDVFYTHDAAYLRIEQNWESYERQWSDGQD